jgi:hypothetical protein
VGRRSWRTTDTKQAHAFQFKLTPFNFGGLRNKVEIHLPKMLSRLIGFGGFAAPAGVAQGGL